MPKKTKKEKVGRVIEVSKEDNILLKQYFNYAYERGVTLTNLEICNQMFSRGLHEVAKSMIMDSEPNN